MTSSTEKVIAAPKVYLCCGNKTGVSNPAEWLGVDIREPCDLKVDVLTIERIEADEIFATPPCNGFTDLPWRPATNAGTDILKHCRKLCEQAPRWLLENNRWAQRIIGPADFHRGSHYFWGNLLVAEFVHVKMKTSGLKPLERAAMLQGVVVE